MSNSVQPQFRLLWIGLFLALGVAAQPQPTSTPIRVWTFGVPTPVDLPRETRTVTDARLAIIRAHSPVRLENDGRLFQVLPTLHHNINHWIYVPRGRAATNIFIVCMWQDRAAVFESKANPLDWDALMQWAVATFTLQPVMPQRFCLVRDRQILRYGSSLTGLRHGQLFAIGMNFDQQGPVMYLTPWEEEEELPVYTRSDWGGPLNAGPAGQRPHQLPAGTASASTMHTALAAEAGSAPVALDHVMETCDVACQTPISLSPNDTSLLAWEAATHQLGETLRLLRSIAGNQGHRVATTTSSMPARPSSEPGLVAASASSTARIADVSVWAVGFWSAAGLARFCRPALWITLLLSVYGMHTEMNPTDTDIPPHPVLARADHYVSVYGSVPDFAIPTYGDCISLAVRQATPSQYGLLQAHLSPTWQARQAGRITLLPDCPARTAARFYIYHPGCLRRPVTGRLLMSPDCLHVMLAVCSQWATREGLAPIVPVHPQPDRSAVHLITSAPREDQVHVLLWSPRLSVPSVLSRRIEARELAAFSMGTQTGTVLPPVGAAHAGQIVLRDGDCLPFWAAEASAAGSRARGTSPGHPVALWLAAWTLRSETRYLPVAIIASLVTSVKAMQATNARSETPLHMSCHMHGNTRGLPATRVGTGAPLEPDDIRYGPPTAVTHILWRGGDIMTCLRMCSCTTVDVAETALLMDVPPALGASLQLDPIPPRITAVHWQIYSTSSSASAPPLLAFAFALVAVFSPRWTQSAAWLSTAAVMTVGLLCHAAALASNHTHAHKAAAWSAASSAAYERSPGATDQC